MPGKKPKAGYKQPDTHVSPGQAAAPGSPSAGSPGQAAAPGRPSAGSPEQAAAPGSPSAGSPGQAAAPGSFKNSKNEKPEAINYVYILKCADDTLYCGWTTDLENRVAAHNGADGGRGPGAKYTRSRRPVELVYHEEFTTKSQALKREAAIKKMSRTQKNKLINNGI